MRILLVEDDPELGALIARGMRDASYAVDVAQTYTAAVGSMRVNSYDLLCLDLRLPDGDGVDLCRELRGQNPDLDLHAPGRILMLTARDGVADRVAGLDAGADDYLVKPFELDELLARIRALLRRESPSDTNLSAAGIALDTATGRAWRRDRELNLTSRELAMLRYFLAHPGEMLSAEDLFEHLWDDQANPFTNSVHVILSRLRAKLGPPPVIETIRGSGYRMRIEP